jgi:hypothetical protein
MFTTIVCSKCVTNKNTLNDTPICIYSKEWPFNFYGVWGLCFLNIFLLPNFMAKYILTLKIYRLNDDPAVFSKKFGKIWKKVVFFMSRKIRFFFYVNYFFLDLGMKKGREWLFNFNERWWLCFCYIFLSPNFMEKMSWPFKVCKLNN